MNFQPQNNLPAVPAPVQAPVMSAIQTFHHTNFLQQFGTEEFQATHKIGPNGRFPIWDVRQQAQPNLKLGPLGNSMSHIGRIVYGVPKQYSAQHGYNWDYQELADQGFRPDYINAVLATEALDAHEATLEDIDHMRLWAASKKNGIQYVPAALCPEINAAAKSGDWFEAKQAAKCITAAGASVMLDYDENLGPDMIKEEKVAEPAYGEHVQNGVKRPPNSWILYRRDAHKQIVKVYPKMKNTDISKVVSLMWKREKDHVKKFYINYADEINQNFRQNFPNYRFSPRRAGERQRRAPRASTGIQPLAPHIIEWVIENLSPLSQGRCQAYGISTDHNGQIVNMAGANPANPANQAQLPVAQLPAAQLPAAQLPVAQLPVAQLPVAQLPATVPDAVTSSTSDGEGDQTMESAISDSEDDQVTMEEAIAGLDQDVVQDLLDFFETGEIA